MTAAWHGTSREPRPANLDRGAADHERLPLGQVARIPAQHPPELLHREPPTEPRARVLLGARDEGDPESAVERTAPPGAVGRLAPAHSANRPSNGPGPLG